MLLALAEQPGPLCFRVNQAGAFALRAFARVSTQAEAKRLSHRELVERELFCQIDTGFGLRDPVGFSEPIPVRRCLRLN